VLPAVLPPAPFLYAIIDTAFLAGRSVDALVAELASGGAALLQLRAKQETDARLLELARDAVAASRAARVPLLINDRPDVARIVGADGVHVGQDDLPADVVRRLLPRGALVGVSTHDPAQLEAACRMPVDYVAVGPIFPTRSKDRPDAVVGVEFVREARKATRLPLVAIGGITSGNAASVVAAGADAVAVIAALLAGPDARQAAARLREGLGGT
jgi:thiamine-phosphate pyrophosphorylase